MSSEQAKVFCVVPTNRPESLRRFLAEWEGKGGWDHLVVVEDVPALSKDRTEAVFDNWTECPVSHYSHTEIRRELGDDAWIVSKQDSACRCFGFYAAWKAGADYVLTLDDDCYPDHIPIVRQHLDRMSLEYRWVTSCPGLHVRGLPYRTMSGHQLPPAAVNVGLWSGVPDLDAKTQLTSWSGRSDFTPPPGSHSILPGQYVPVSGMNLMVARRALPLFYFPLMGEGQPYRRFDDIWAGVIAKKVMDHLGMRLTVGEPFVRHERASDSKVNLEKEAPGMLANEHFWRVIDAVKLPGYYTQANECVGFVGRYLEDRLPKEVHAYPVPGFVPYLRQFGKALRVWARLFAKEGGAA